MKHCWDCDKQKDKSEFYNNKCNYDGLSSACALCVRKRSSGYYRQHRNEVAKRVRDYWKTPNGKELSRIKTKRMMEKYPEKFRTRMLTRMYVKTGKIEKKPCEVCGDSNVEAHHTDYSDAINVHWYCPYHHRVVEGRSL